MMPTNIILNNESLNQLEPFVIKYCFPQLAKRACCDAIIFFRSFYNLFYSSFLFILVLNPGPNKKSHSYFSCSHWSVNSLPTDNY